jgi:hypothetical protein
MSEMQRRRRLDLLTPAERAIVDAVDAVEKVGADERLTNAVILLGRARELVGDYLDESSALPPKPETPP